MITLLPIVCLLMFYFSMFSITSLQPFLFYELRPNITIAIIN